MRRGEGGGGGCGAARFGLSLRRPDSFARMGVTPREPGGEAGGLPHASAGSRARCSSAAGSPGGAGRRSSARRERRRLRASGPAPSCPPGPSSGLTITTKDSLWTDGSPQPPPQQLSSKGAAILPGPTSPVPEVLLPPNFRQVKVRGGARQGKGPLGLWRGAERTTGGLKARLESAWPRA